MVGEAVYDALVDNFKGAVDLGKPGLAHQSLSVIALLLGEGEEHAWDKALQLVGEDHGQAYKNMTKANNDPEPDEFARPYVQAFRDAVMFNQYGDVIRLDESAAVQAIDGLVRTIDDGENSAWKLACDQIGARYEPVFISLQSRFTRPQQSQPNLSSKDLPSLDFTNPL